MRRKFLALIIVFFLLGLVFPPNLAGEDLAGEEETLPKASSTEVSTYASKEVIVKFKPEVTQAKEDLVKLKAGVVATEAVEFKKDSAEEIQLVRVKAGASVKEAAKKLASQSAVEFAEPNYFRSLTLVPNDTYYSLQWAHSRISSPAAWDVTTGSSTATIAVIDTGVDYNHPDLSAKVIKGPDYFNDDLDPKDDSGHGTHVAGIAAAISNNSLGVAGVSWGSNILAIKALGPLGGYDFDIAQGITYAANNGAKVINLSLGGSSYSQTLKNAVDYAYSKGVVIVAATGNNNSGVLYPAAYPNVIGVGATNENDARTSPTDWGPGYGSNYGPEVDVVAPGNNIASTYLGSAYAYMSGTSMATPYVAGLAALVLTQNSSFTPSQVESQIENTADDLGSPGRDDYYGYGRINLYNALVTPPPPPAGSTNALFGWGNPGSGDIPSVGDFNNDGKEETAIFRPSAAQWYFKWDFANDLTNGFTNWGLVGDHPLVGDFNKDGLDDIGIFRPSTGQWYFNYGPNYDSLTDFAFRWGMPGDTPLVGDFDGDTQTDVALRRPSTAQWFLNWGILDSNSDAAFQWGGAGSGDIPIVGDFNSNGSQEIAIFRPSAAQWYFKWDFTNNDTSGFINWGLVGDYPLIGDFDGDTRRDDISIFRPSKGHWYFNWGPSYDSATDHSFQWGMPGDTPLVGNFGGDTRSDGGIRRSSAAQWFFNWSSLP